MCSSKYNMEDKRQTRKMNKVFWSVFRPYHGGKIVLTKVKTYKERSNIHSE